MNKLLFSLMAFIMSLHMLSAQEVKIVTLMFNPSDFTFSYDATGDLEVSSYKYNVSYGDNTDEPGLPLVPINVAIPSGTSFSGMSVKGEHKLLLENVTLTANPIPMPTNQIGTRFGVNNPQYAHSSYPLSVAEYVGTSFIDGFTLLDFLVCPFEYDAQNKALYFNERITLTINLTTSHEQIVAPMGGGKNMSNIVKFLVVNADEINESLPTNNISSVNNELIEYVIITSSDLASSFYPLAQWKTTKGVMTKIITIEAIKANYSGDTAQLKIKSCLYDLYQHHGLKYVLLGGDDTIIPVQGCYGAAGSYIDSTIPTDLFFGCFDGSFNWDANGNGIYGETTDDINMMPSIYVTRMPVRTTDDVQAFVSKLLAYEKTPTINGWNNEILMAGTKLWANYSSTQSDAEAKGDNLYTNYIQPYWDGTRKKFYDTYTDFIGGADYAFNSANLQSQLGNGYAFFDIATHGNQTIWALESGTYFGSLAQTLSNNKFTIVTTMACLTNAFDNSIEGGTSDPCLSEAFIRNKNSGVIAFLGCSRYGWGYAGGSRTLGPSLQYEAQFYKNLFSSSFQNKNYGVLVTAAKIAEINASKAYNAFRWVQFGLNPIGDPEMPIYTSTPKEFDNCSVKSEDGYIHIDTGIEGCNICVMSKDDDGATYYKVQNNVKEASFPNIPTSVSICITKQNYIPTILESSIIYIQNETVTGTKVYNADFIKVGSSITATKPTGPVVFDRGNIQLKAKSITIEPETTINSNTNFIMSNQ